jgi:hypothetical protein
MEPAPGNGGPLQWEALYEAALLEGDSGEVPQRITEAEQAVMSRMADLASSADSAAEKQSLIDALNVLRDLRRLNQNDAA